MSRLLKAAIALVALLAVLQVGVPVLAARAVAAELARRGIPAARVQVTAFPFWMLAQGRFQDLRVAAPSARLGPVPVEGLTADWRNGQVAIRPLEAGNLVVQREGRLQVRFRLTGTGVADLLASSGVVRNPVVHIHDGILDVTGTLTLDGIALPLSTSGRLGLSPHGRHIVYQPANVDGLDLPVPTAITVLNVSSLGLPLALHLTGLVVGTGTVAVTLENRP
ncbi:conserved exported protein of unknown function [Candidatus Hydrogenisulfobacillus filiaventi]|uniref:DUF2993 domain-containing protein n=1 Tax=Candidatus Hydrogenisulfobacillus filiaventi TaxID=2707344 RepID=A0A6F8ZE62_9FIRM|nr:hypothetical protein [Bacillota bacterium]CAB1128158.1 conserved exported protein of unknown function [Candidatus Hydrogenisulfobacillus filiaventi]